MTTIKGITVTLIERVKNGVDAFGNDVYADVETEVDNVLIEPTSDTDQVEEYNLYGKKSTYTLHIPKGDTHKWSEAKVKFFGGEWATFGDMVLYQEELLPLSWKGKVKVEKYGKWSIT